ncbi:MAG: PilZ domain-containing protein [Candidatus Omnitrophica bacterium]|nr:PilZ domain-containing protein [Candidatus Omnitrophota bacterium]
MKKEEFEKRRYVRISTVFPVEFYVLDKDGKKITPYLQGFTNNIGKGGLCVAVNDLWWGFWDRFTEESILYLVIEVPFRKNPILAKGRIVWRKREKLERFTRCSLGIEFTEISPSLKRTLFRYAISKKIFPYLVSSMIAFLILFSFLIWIREEKLFQKNRSLVVKYHSLLEESAKLRSQLSEETKLLTFVKNRKSKLEEELSFLKEELSFWQTRYNQLLKQEMEVREKERATKALQDKMRELKAQIESLEKENRFLKEKFKKEEDIKSRLSQEVNILEEEKIDYVKRIVRGMYEWITTRQDLNSGLVLSYEGDRELSRVAFTYDQALAVIVFILFKDNSKARKVLDFYLNQIENKKPIYNGYYTNGGIFEYVVSSGPNAWIGLASLNYVKFTNERRYLKIAKAVADFLLKMMDKEGGIRGGPNFYWYSTEHNLDCYAFFKMMGELTNNSYYLDVSQKIKRWIDTYAYTDKGIPVNRGKGDATIATDTYAWSITALGPQELISLKMDPEVILDFAVKNCRVTTHFKVKNRKISVTGFDFAKAKNLPRGGVVSCEWTAQMILAFEILSNYYQDKEPDKANYYWERANYYFEELQKMVINSPSPLGKANPTLPYASASFVDTGHGWRTPKGDKVGSLASTAYFLISYLGYNPLGGEFLSNSLKRAYEQRTYKAYTKAN